MAEIRINATGGLKLYDADDSHYAQILAGTISSNVDALTLGSSSATFGIPVTVGEDDTGHDVKLFGATASRYWLWDESADGVVQRGTLTVGVDDTGHDVKLFGASAGAYMEWDESVNLLDLRGATAAGPGNLKLTTGELTVVDADVLGKIEFQAPLEASGTDAILVSAAIWAEADDTFAAGVNNTDLVFALGKSEAAAEKFRFTADAEIGVAGANYGTDGQVLTSGGAGAAVAWEDAGGGDLNFGGDTFGADKTIGSNDNYDLTFETNNTARLLLQNDGKLATGAETAPDVGAGGLTLDQNAVDSDIITFKSSDVAHTCTNLSEADTYFNIRKASAAGGTRVWSFSDGGSENVYTLRAVTDGTASTEKATGGTGLISLRSSQTSSSDTAALASNGNIISVHSHNTTRFIFDAEGELHCGNTTLVSLDSYDDAQLARTVDKMTPAGVINSKFDKFVKYNHENLAEIGLVGREKDGTPNTMLNVTMLQRLHNGAIWQQYEKHNQLLDAVYDLAKEAVGEEKANAILEKHEVKRLN